MQRQILLGHAKLDILEWVKSQPYTGDAGKIYQDSVDAFAGINSNDPEIKIGFTEAALKMLYQKMIEIGDYTGALAALKEYSKLNKLGEKQKPKGIQRYNG